MPTQRPTAKQQQVLDFIKHNLAEKGFAPTYSEIGKHCGITKGAVKNHLDALEARGLILRNANESRTIKIADGKKKPKNRKLPLQPRKLERLVAEISTRLKKLESIQLVGAK